jgi:quercetin dioxygenase-like cupin family protein
MKRLLLSLALGALSIAPSRAQTIEVIPAASREAVRGAAENFTGTAIVEMLFVARPQTRAGAAQVTFAPGGRTVWHSHPAGQHIFVTTGSGWIQEWNGQKRKIAAGDVVWTPPGVKHWHGATPTTVMTHVAIQETVDGKNVEWLEAVTEAQYQR